MATPQARRVSATRRLSVDDWVEAGLVALAEEGLSAIKVDRLCARMGVTKGSFYWHFTDLSSYLDVIADRWNAVRDSVRIELSDCEQLPPRERLRSILAAFAEQRQWTLERAVRDWARVDPRVAERVRASDRWVLELVRGAFLDAGFEQRDAGVRAHGLFYAGVGYLHVAREEDIARGLEERHLLIDILLGR